MQTAVSTLSLVMIELKSCWSFQKLKQRGEPFVKATYKSRGMDHLSLNVLKCKAKLDIRSMEAT